MTDHDDPLDAFFDANRKHGARPGETLLARIEDDAMAVIEARARDARPEPTPWWRDLVRLLGGWPAGAGLGTAALAGLVIGFSLPDAVSSVGVPLLGDVSFDESALAPTYGTAWLDSFEE